MEVSAPLSKAMEVGGGRWGVEGAKVEGGSASFSDRLFSDRPQSQAASRNGSEDVQLTAPVPPRFALPAHARLGRRRSTGRLYTNSLKLSHTTVYMHELVGRFLPSNFPTLIP